MVWSHRAGLDGHGLCTCVLCSVLWCEHWSWKWGSATGEGLALPCALRWLWFGESQSGPLSNFLHHFGEPNFRQLLGIYSYWNSGRTVPLVLPISLSSHFFPDSNSHFSESTKGSLPVSLLNPHCYWFSIYFLFIYQHIITCKDITLLFATILALPYLSW